MATKKKTVEESRFNCRSLEEIRFIYISTVNALLELDLKERETNNHCIVFDSVAKDGKAYIGVKLANFQKVVELFENKYAQLHNEKPLSARQIKSDFVKLGMVEEKIKSMSDAATGAGQTRVVPIMLERFFEWNNISLLHVDTSAEIAKGNETYIREWLEQQSSLKLE